MTPSTPLSNASTPEWLYRDRIEAEEEESEFQHHYETIGPREPWRMTPVKFSQAFPGKYLRGSDLDGREFTLTIEHITQEDVSQENEASEIKPVVSFRGASKSLALNVTNANILAAAFGDDMEDCIGKTVILYFDPTVQYKKRITGGLRLRVPGQSASAQPPAPEPEPERTPLPRADEYDTPDDAIPF